MRIFLLAVPAAVVAAQGTRITSLPGLTTLPPFAMYSGYIPYNSPLLGSTHSIFHWVVESTGNPQKDPIVFWVSVEGRGRREEKGTASSDFFAKILPDLLTSYLPALMRPRYRPMADLAAAAFTAWALSTALFLLSKTALWL
jgi:hypothetical protein